MKKRILASLMCVCLLVGLLPTAALAAEDPTDEATACTVTEGCTLEDGHEGECVTTPDEPETPEDGDENDYYETDDVTDGEGGIMLLADGDTAQPKSGTCGATGNESNVTWELAVNNDDETNPTYTLTISGTGAMADYGYADRNLPWGWLRDQNNVNTSITKLVVNKGVTHIGAWAFWKCTALTEVSLPDSLTSIGDSAFESAEDLTGEFALKNVTGVNGRAFKNCGISSFTVAESNSAYKVKDDILYSADGTTLICCPHGKKGAINDSYFSDVSAISDYAFYKSQLTGNLTVSNVTIGEYAFQDCTGLTSVNISNLGAVNKGAFQGCTQVTSIAIGNGITSIGTSAFENCKAATTLTLGSSIETIGDNAFKGNSKISGNLVIPDSVTTIGASAFENCTGLNGTLTLSKNLTSIGERAFQHTGFTGTLVIPYGVTELPASVFYRDNSSATNNFTCIVYPTALASIEGTAFAYNTITQGLYPSTMTDNLLNSNWKPHAAKYTLASGDALSMEKGSTLAMMTVTPGKVSGASGADAEYGASSITYESSDTSVATVDNNGTITAIGDAGSKATITALYSNIPFAKIEVTVAAKSVSVTMSDRNEEYDGTAKTIEATAGGSEALPDDLTLVYSYKKSDADDSTYTHIPPSAPGTYTVKVESGNVNYTLTEPTTATLTISAPSGKANVGSNTTVTDPASLVYDGTSKTYTAAYEGISQWTIVYYGADGKKLESAPVNAGTYTVTINGSSESSYASITQEFTITPATLTITPNNKTAYVGDALPTLGADDYTVTGLVGNDALSKAPTLAYDDGTDMNTTGTYAINANGAEAGNNYTITYVDGTLTVSRRSSGGGGGSSSGSSSSTTTETVTNKDGSKTTTVTDKKTGTVTETTKFKDGSTLVVETKKDGTVTTTETAANGVKVKTVDEPGEDVTATVTIPRSVGTATVTVPADVTPGTVAVDAKTGEVVKLSVPTEDGVTVKLDGSADLVLVDKSKDFTDTRNHWAEDAIDFATAHGMFGGTSATTFTPDGSMTRGMIAVVLHNFEDNPDHAFAGSFDDVHPDSWYADGIHWMVDNGIAGGYGNGKFGADDKITREQLATFLYRYAGVMGYGTSGGASLSGFSDAGSVSGYATEAMQWAVGNGLIGGMGNGTLAPQGNATRAQVATILMRFVENLTK